MADCSSAIRDCFKNAQEGLDWLNQVEVDLHKAHASLREI